jgi:O-antigen/teichoic acid export membrane protein
MPFTFALPLLFGELQGEQRFAAFAAIAVGQAALKLVAAVAIGFFLGPFGVVLGISLAGAVTYLVVRHLVRRKLALRARWPWQRPALAYLAIILPSTLALAVLLSADVLLVKHFFPATIAGEYGAVAALGRAIFWGAGGVAAVLFPKIVFRESQGRTSLPLILVSLCLVAVGGGVALLVISLGSKPLLTAFAGQLYVGGAQYLPWYAFGMTLLGAAAVLTATHQSRGKRTFLNLLVPIAVLEPVLIILWHGSVMQVISILDVSMAALVVGLLALYLTDKRRYAAVGDSATTAALTPRVAEGIG